jgi:hypothetical protein
MRFSVLAMSASMLLVPCGRAQSLGAANVATSAKRGQLPVMPPKPPAADCGSPCTSGPHPRPQRGDLSLQSIPRSRKERVADKKFWAVAGGAMGTSLLVVAATSHCRRTVGVNSCIGADGEFNVIQGIQIGVSGIMTGLGYWWKRSDQETHTAHAQWWVFPVGITAFNAFRAADQYSKHCQRGAVFNGHTCK